MYTSDAFKHSIGIPFYSNLQCSTFGLDSLDHCFDKKHYQTYGDVNYCFNEIGYRDRSVSQYRGDEILAIGDSFTVGLGVNSADCWTTQLENMLGHPVLNFSLNGASNDWISRKTESLLHFFQPKCIIIHYTFCHRRERPFTDWHDNERTESDAVYSNDENYINWKYNFDKINKLCENIPVVHSGITGWNYDSKDVDILTVDKIDLARDGFHYGVNTHKQLATNLLDCVSHLSLEP
jgi:hypothetical protein